MADKTAIRHNTGPGPTRDNTDNTEPISAEIATFIAEIDCPRFVNVAAAAFYGFLCLGQTLACSRIITSEKSITADFSALCLMLISVRSLASPGLLVLLGSVGSLILNIQIFG